jgi:hypothetical protein
LPILYRKYQMLFFQHKCVACYALLCHSKCIA